MAPNPAILAIQRASKAQGLDWRPLAAVSHVESGLRADAIGDGGHAFGLFQNNNAGGTITGDPNPRRFLDPNVSAQYTARAVGKLGLAGKTPEQQIHDIVYRYERPADPAGEYRRALEAYQARFAGAGAQPGVPARVTPAASRTPAPATAAPDYTFLQSGLNAAQGTTQRALGALSAISGAPAPAAMPALDLSALAPRAATAPESVPKVPGDHIVPLRGKTAPTKLDTQGQKAVALARKFMGIPYLFGGANPKTGFDCSGLLKYVWHENGVEIPHNAQAQYDVATKVDAKHLAPGDAVFFRDKTGIHHVGMYIGGPNRQFIQAPHTGDHVKISSLNESYYASQFAGGGKFT